jgi:hypothetical protein
MKKIYMLAITMVIAGLMITSATSMATTNDTLSENDAQTLMVPSHSVNPVGIKTTQGTASRDGTLIETGDYPAYHPSIATDTGSSMFIGFDGSQDGVSYFPTFLASGDGGQTWPDGGYFQESAGASMPSVDFKTGHFYATFQPSPDTSGQIWLVDATDVSNIAGSTWDFTADNFNSFISFHVACYTDIPANDSWNWGGLAFTGYNGYSGDIPGCPFVFYQSDDTGQGIIGWVNNVAGCVHANNDIDQVTKMCYSAYDRLVAPNYQLFVRKDNYGKWNWNSGGGYYSHPMVTTKSITASGNLMYPDIAADNNTVILVAQSDVAGNQDIVCYYSTNGFTSYLSSVIANAGEDELYPQVAFMKTGIAICTYIRGTASYYKTSTDGGATWSSENRVSDEQIAPVENGAKDLYGIGGDAYAIWQDGRGAVTNIYFDKFAHTSAPHIEIGTVAGGIGKVTMEIKNTGDGDASNVAWSIGVTGGILNKINVQSAGVLPTLAAGASTTVQTNKTIFGLGKLSISLSADQATATKTGKILLIFVRGIA